MEVAKGQIVEKVYYERPDNERRCWKCKWSRYDIEHLGDWCGRSPTPLGLSEYLLVHPMGTCAYFEEEDD